MIPRSPLIKKNRHELSFEIIKLHQFTKKGPFSKNLIGSLLSGHLIWASGSPQVHSPFNSNQFHSIYSLRSNRRVATILLNKQERVVVLWTSQCEAGGAVCHGMFFYEQSQRCAKLRLRTFAFSARQKGKATTQRTTHYICTGTDASLIYSAIHSTMDHVHRLLLKICCLTFQMN